VTNDDRLQQLLDIEAIKQLKARYFRAIDTKDWNAFAEVFTPDAVMELPEADGEERGRDAIVAAVSAILEGARTVHHGHMPEIEITGPDSATGVWAMADYVEWPRLETGARVGIIGYGHYRERYLRADGGWRIAHLRLERLRVDPLS
jgi:uncharacterized protein (TIGR02246 family)